MERQGTHYYIYRRSSGFPDCHFSLIVSFVFIKKTSLICKDSDNFCTFATQMPLLAFYYSLNSIIMDDYHAETFTFKA